GDAKYQKPVAWFRNKRTGRPISTQRFSGTGGGRHFPGMEGKRPPMPAAGGDGQRKDHGLYEADRKGTAGRTPGDRPDSGDRADLSECGTVPRILRGSDRSPEFKNDAGAAL